MSQCRLYPFRRFVLHTANVALISVRGCSTVSLLKPGTGIVRHCLDLPSTKQIGTHHDSRIMGEWGMLRIGKAYRVGGFFNETSQTPRFPRPETLRETRVTMDCVGVRTSDRLEASVRYRNKDGAGSWINANHNARIYGGRRLSRWFEANLAVGDDVRIEAIEPLQTYRLTQPGMTSAQADPAKEHQTRQRLDHSSSESRRVEVQRHVPRHETEQRARRGRKSSPPVPTLGDLEEARRVFELEEPRGLFYKVASELVDRALRGESSTSVSEAVAVLLQTWNAQFYRFRGGFTETDYRTIDALLQKHMGDLLKLRPLSIETASSEQLDHASWIFSAFEPGLGATGASKCLHLLAPRLYPLWENGIQKAYGFYLTYAPDRSRDYRRFMEVARQSILAFGGESALGRNPLKAWDEWNYCNYGPRGK